MAQDPRSDLVGGFMMLGGGNMSNISWTNSVMEEGSRGPWSTGHGCAEKGAYEYRGASAASREAARAPLHESPLWMFDHCFFPYTFNGNLIIGGGEQQYPAGNLFPPNVSAVGCDAEHCLAPLSAYRGTATDGRDPGAAIDAVLSAVHGVRDGHGQPLGTLAQL